MPGAHRRMVQFIGLALAVCASIGGCEFKCSCDDRGSLEEAIDEVGDEVGDVVDKVKEKKP